MQVNFHEPMSFLQRLTEDFEYSECLDKAARCDDSCEQLAYVAAFTASSYANSSLRAGKPFNPLLGETFECDRYDDLGWRSIAEQVNNVIRDKIVPLIGRFPRFWGNFLHFCDFPRSVI